jgi:uncharacterized protein
LKITGLIWLQDVVEKLARTHQVQEREVERFWKAGPASSSLKRVTGQEKMFTPALGRSDAGRYLAVFFVYTKDQRALILSARDMSDAERKRYERK